MMTWDIKLKRTKKKRRNKTKKISNKKGEKQKQTTESPEAEVNVLWI